MLATFCELVAPVSAISAVFLLFFGPILATRFYLLLLVVYFCGFLVLQSFHFYKFYLTVGKIKKVVRHWNASQRAYTHAAHASTSSILTSRSASTDTSTPTSGASTPTRLSSSLLEDERLEEMEATLKLYEDAEFVHAFIVPNYGEPEALLRDTIKRLSHHRWLECTYKHILHRNATTNYVIILAMEASEAGYQQKAESLEAYFSGSFLHFITTAHPANIPGESRGKGSNVAWAARHGCAELLNRHVDRRRIILTVSDSDSAIPELYVREVEKALGEVEDPYNAIFCPPIFFSRNAHEVPAAVRVTDVTWSTMVMQNLSNGRGINYPCSTYSLSMVLAEKVGYWDTDADSVGEDLHMWLKCFFKTGGAARSVPIFVPINLTNVQTTGYVNNLWARYVQAKRHYNGVADVAYALKQAIISEPKPSLGASKEFVYSGPVAPRSFVSRLMSRYIRVPAIPLWYDKLIVCLKVLEAHMIPATSGWLMFAAVPVMQFLLFPPPVIADWYEGPEDSVNPVVYSSFYSTVWDIIKIVTIFLPFPLFGMLALYEHLHRFCDNELFKKAKSEHRTWRNLTDYIWLPVSAWCFMTIPSGLACVKRLSKSEEAYH
ncbi:hypothetical protein BZG36_04918, partial [Bifiguratus adelaidae]